MATVHIESNIGDIAKVVLMPGDPKRSEYIAKKYLQHYRLVNEVRQISNNFSIWNGYSKYGNIFL